MEEIGVPLFMLGVWGFSTACWVLIMRKAGYGRWIGLWSVIPPVPFILLVVLGFGKWPILR